MYADDSDILSLVIKSSGNTNTSVQTFRCSNLLCLNCTEVFAKTTRFLKQNSYTCIIFIEVFTPYNSHLSKILQNYCDIVLNPSFCTFTCNEALYSVK